MPIDRPSIITAAAALPVAARTAAADAAVPCDDRHARGLARLAEVSGPQGAAVVGWLDDIGPDLGRYIVEFTYGDIFARPGLDTRTREIATVAALTVMGTAAPQLGVHIHAALNVGVSREEIVETIIQMIPYAGFPAALAAVTIARDVFTPRAT